MHTGILYNWEKLYCHAKKYIDSFINCVDFIIYSGGEIGLDPDMIKLAEADIGVEYTKGTDDQETKIHAAAKELYLATCFFLWADKHQHGRLIMEQCGITRMGLPISFH